MTFVRDDLRPIQRRGAVLLAVFAALLLLLLGRLWLLQVIQGDRWRTAAENNRLRRVPLEAPRGVVTDVNGEVILDNRCTYTDPDLFSHRRGAPTGRQAGLIWRPE